MPSVWSVFLTRFALLLTLFSTVTLAEGAYNLPWDAPNPLGERFSWGGESVTLPGIKTGPSGVSHRYLAQEIKLGLAARPLDRIAALATLKWQKSYTVGSPDGDDSLGLESAYMSWLGEDGDPNLSLGRYYYEDRRGFLFHQTVDGWHGQWQWQQDDWRWRGRLFSGHQGKWREDLLGAGQSDSRFHFAELQAQKHDRFLSVYAFSRRTEDEDNPTLLGVRSRGQLHQRVDHWLELIMARGTSGEQKLRGYGLDVGAIWQWHPSLSFIGGYAYGSGGESGAVDRRFRQTGLHLNNGWIGKGGSKLKYYGELVKPELSNIAISTLGVRWLPSEFASVELLHHHYRQPSPSDRFYGYGLKVAPNGVNGDLGQELDLVIGYRRIKGLKLELNLAHFRPGGAFSGRLTPQNLVYLEFRYRL
jgi:hypothetical protein